jgi:hypothetical protein
VTDSRFERSFVGQVQSQLVPEALLGDLASLEASFSTFLQRSQRVVLAWRAGLSVVLVMALAFVASRVDSPLLVGGCGLVVLAPLVWIATAVLVPMVMLGRSRLAQGGGLTLQVGVPIEVTDRGLTGGELHLPWEAVTSITDEADALVVRGVDRSARRLFRIVLSPRSFTSSDDRAGVLRALRARMTSTPT